MNKIITTIYLFHYLFNHSFLHLAQVLGTRIQSQFKAYIMYLLESLATLLLYITRVFLLALIVFFVTLACSCYFLKKSISNCEH